LNEEHPRSDFESRRFEELSAKLDAHHADFEALQAQADQADQRGVMALKAPPPAEENPQPPIPAPPWTTTSWHTS
jgi:hypothetical protein